MKKIKTDIISPTPYLREIIDLLGKIPGTGGMITINKGSSIGPSISIQSAGGECDIISSHRIEKINKMILRTLPRKLKKRFKKKHNL